MLLIGSPLPPPPQMDHAQWQSLFSSVTSSLPHPEDLLSPPLTGCLTSFHLETPVFFPFLAILSLESFICSTFSSFPSDSWHTQLTPLSVFKLSLDSHTCFVVFNYRLLSDNTRLYIFPSHFTDLSFDVPWTPLFQTCPKSNLPWSPLNLPLPCSLSHGMEPLDPGIRSLGAGFDSVISLRPTFNQLPIWPVSPYMYLLINSLLPFLPGLCLDSKPHYLSPELWL